MPKRTDLDDTDRDILRILSEDARISNSKMAKMLNMAPSGVLKRVRRLEKTGVIKGYETRISDKALGLGLTSFVMVNSDEPLGSISSGKIIAQFPEVQEVHFMAGEYWYLLKVKAEDTDSYMEFIKKLGAVEGLRDCRSTFVLGTIKETIALKIEPPEDSD